MPATELEIFETEVVYGDQSLGTTTVGITIDDSGDKPVIEIFNLQENEGAHTVEHVFQVAPAIRDQYFPDLAVQDIEWKITNNYMRVGASFQEIDGRVVRADFPNGIPKGRPFMSFEEFNRSMNAPEGFDVHYSERFGGDITGAGGPVTVVAYEMSEHPQKIQYMISPYGGEPNVVLIDASRFMPDWQVDDAVNIGEGEGYIFNSDIETAIKYTDIEPEKGISYAHAMGVFHYEPDSQLDHAISVTGRHRTANAATLGSPFVALHFYGNDEQLEAFKARYEYQGEQATNSPEFIAGSDALLSETRTSSPVVSKDFRERFPILFDTETDALADLTPTEFLGLYQEINTFLRDNGHTLSVSDDGSDGRILTAAAPPEIVSGIQALLFEYELSSELREWYSGQLTLLLQEPIERLLLNQGEDLALQDVKAFLSDVALKAGFDGEIDLIFTSDLSSAGASFNGIQDIDGTRVARFSISDTLNNLSLAEILSHELTHMFLDPKSEVTVFDNIPYALRPEIDLIMFSQSDMYFDASFTSDFLYRNQPAEMFPEFAEQIALNIQREASLRLTGLEYERPAETRVRGLGLHSERVFATAEQVRDQRRTAEFASSFGELVIEDSLTPAQRTAIVTAADVEGGRIAAKAGLALAPLDFVNRFNYISRAADQGSLGLAAEETAIGAIALSAAYADYLSLKSARGISQVAGKLSLPLAVAYGTYETAMGLRQGDMDRALNGGGGTAGAIAGSIAGGNFARVIPSKWAKAAFMIGGGVVGAIYGSDMAKTTHAMLFTDADGSFVDASEMYEQLNAMIVDAENGRHGWQMMWQRKHLIDGNENINPEDYPAAYALYQQLKLTLENQEPPPENPEQEAIKLLRNEAYRRLLDDGELIIPGPYNPADNPKLEEIFGDQIAATAQLFDDNAIALQAAVTFGQLNAETGAGFSVDAYHIINNLWHDRGDTEKMAEIIKNNPHIGLLLERHEAALEGISINDDGDVVIADEAAVSALLGDIEHFAQRYSLELTEAERTALIGDDLDHMDENTFFQKWVNAIEELGVEIDGDVARELEKMRDILEQEGNVLASENEASDAMDALFDAAKSLSQVLSTEFNAQSIVDHVTTNGTDNIPIQAFKK